MVKSDIEVITKYFEEYNGNKIRMKYFHNEWDNFKIIIDWEFDEVYQLNSDHEIQGIELLTLEEFKGRFKSFTGEDLY